MIPQPVYIYHITHVNNLSSIITDGGLRTCCDLRDAGVNYTDIAHETLQDWRATKEVYCGPGGVIHDYVPFYFAPRSPMLCAIHNGRVPNYREGQGQVLHLVSSVEAVRGATLSFVFTDGHSRIDFTEFYDDVSYLDQIDWQIMKEKYWRDTIADNDRKRRRQAEFLVHKFFPWDLVELIGVSGSRMKARVESILIECDHKPLVSVHSDWYY
jgi:ssDNA thymidine ADP-ribosyltransferase, DarT